MSCGDPWPLSREYCRGEFRGQMIRTDASGTSHRWRDEQTIRYHAVCLGECKPMGVDRSPTDCDSPVSLRVPAVHSQQPDRCDLSTSRQSARCRSTSNQSIQRSGRPGARARVRPASTRFIAASDSIQPSCIAAPSSNPSHHPSLSRACASSAARVTLSSCSR